MTINQVTKLEIVNDETLGGWKILATFEDGNQAVWGKKIKTERGAKARLTRFHKKIGLSAARPEQS